LNHPSYLNHKTSQESLIPVELVFALDENTSEHNFELKSDEETTFQPNTNFDQMIVNEAESAFLGEVNVSLANTIVVKCYSKIAFQNIKSRDPLLPSYLKVINMQESRLLIPVPPLSIWQKIKAFWGNKTLLHQQERRRAYKQQLKERRNRRAGKASSIKRRCHLLCLEIHTN